MGLGPHGSSLLERVAGWSQPWRDPFAMQLEQQDRREARQQKAIWHAQHRAQPKKPEAPVISYSKRKDEEREWEWIGETIDSKNLIKGAVYPQSYIRKAGFKLPKLAKTTSRKAAQKA